MSFFKKKSRTNAVGIQLSADNVTLSIVDNTAKDKIEVKGYLSLAVDSGDESEGVKAKIQKYLSEKGIVDAPCCLVLDDKDYQLLVIEAPSVPESELAEAVKWKVKDLIQNPLSEVVIDAFLQNDEFSNKKLANVVVVAKELIEKKVQFVESFDLELKAIDIPELSYRNYIESSKHADDPVALVVLQEMSGKLVVIHNQEVCFSRTFSINYKAGLLDELPESDIILELQRSLDYYERQLKKIIPRKIVFCGENVLEENVTDLTRESFSQEIFVENPDFYNFSEEERLCTSKIIASYGACLRQNLLDTSMVRESIPTVLRGAI